MNLVNQMFKLSANKYTVTHKKNNENNVYINNVKFNGNNIRSIKSENINIGFSADTSIPFKSNSKQIKEKFFPAKNIIITKLSFLTKNITSCFKKQEKTILPDYIKLKSIDEKYKSEKKYNRLSLHKQLYRPDATFISQSTNLINGTTLDKEQSKEQVLVNLNDIINSKKSTDSEGTKQLDKLCSHIKNNNNKKIEKILYDYFKTQIPSTYYFNEDHENESEKQKNIKKIAKYITINLSKIKKSKNFLSLENSNLISTNNYQSYFGSAAGYHNNAIFVLDQYLKLHIATHITQTINDEKISIQHTSFNSGDSVVLAGDIKIQNSKILSITGESGHYKPDGLTTIRGIYLLYNKNPEMFDENSYALIRRQSEKNTNKIESICISANELISKMKGIVNDDIKLLNVLSSIDKHNELEMLHYNKLNNHSILDESASNQDYEKSFRNLINQLAKTLATQKTEESTDTQAVINAETITTKL